MTDDTKPQATFDFPIRVYIPDTDAVGVVYHANYLRFADIGRTEWLRAIGYPIERMKEEFGLAPIVARVEVDYKRPAVVDELLTVRSTIMSMTGVRSVMQQDIICGDELKARVVVTLVWINDKGRPSKLPTGMTGLFQAA